MKQILTIIKRNILQLFFLCLVLPGFLWLGTVFIKIRLGMAVNQVTVEFDIDKAHFKNIEVYRVSPGNNRGALVKDSDFLTFYGEKRGYYKSVEIRMPAEVKEHLQSVTLWIGKKTYPFSREKLFNKWKIKQEGDMLILTSPGSTGRRSLLGPLKSIMNWQGDIQVFIFSFLQVLVYTFLCAGAGLLLLIHLKKKIPAELTPELYNNYLSKISAVNKDIFTSAYQKSGSVYTLSEDENDNRHLPFIIDRAGPNLAGKIITGLFCLIILTAVLQRLITIQLPILTADSWGYFGNAVENFQKGGFIESGARTFVYPFFLQVILGTFKSFEAMSYIQHLMGIIAAAFIYLFWLEIGKLLHFKKW